MSKGQIFKIVDEMAVDKMAQHPEISVKEVRMAIYDSIQGYPP
jgi:hypothetical protein